MATDSTFDALESRLHELGYINLTLKEGGSEPSISGVVNGIDTTEAPKSVPDGEDTGPFATLDDPEALIPDDIEEAVAKHGASATVLGHGPDNLHIHISQA